jgi:internalin A
MIDSERLVAEAAQDGREVLDLALGLDPLPPQLWELTHLTALTLSTRRMRVLPEEIGRLANLQQLDLSANHLAHLPDSIGALTELRSLTLMNNQLTRLPESLGNLTRLQVLDLRINRLTGLPDGLGALDELEWLELGTNPLTELPRAVVAAGTQAILSYLRGRLDPESEPQWVSKLIIVGEAAVGKTSLTRMLAHESFDPAEPQTHGIRTTDLMFPHPENGAAMTLHAWDFGGQEIYHATHRFFLTDRSLYLMVWSSRDGYSKGQLRNWLQAITARAPDSPIILIATHSDEHPADLPLAQLRSEFPRIEDSIHVDSSTNRGLTELQESLALHASRLPLMGHRWPRSWMTSADALRAQGRGEVYATPAQMRTIMQSSGVRRQRDQDVVASVLHSLGELLYYPEDSELSDLVVTKPLWVNDQITKLLDSGELLARKGVLDRALMDRVWSDIDPFVQRYLISMMEQFDLAYRTDGDGRSDVCLVVEKLPEDAPDFAAAWSAAGKDTAQIRLVYDFSQFLSLQAGIPTWFIAREHRFTTGTHWRYGALLHSAPEKAWALLVADPLTRRIRLEVRGPYPVAFFSELKASFERIVAQRYPGAPYRLLVPCPCQRESAAVCPHMFEYDDLRTRLAPPHNKEYIECPKSLRDVHVRGLIEGFQPRSLEEIHELLRGVDRKVERIDTRQLLALDFLRNITGLQEAQEVSCPSLFLVTAERRRLLRDRVITLHYYCEYPQQWHPIEPDMGGTLTFSRPPEWFAPIVPHLRLIVQILRHVAPLAGAAIGALGFALDDRTKAAVELMKEFVDQIPAAAVGGRLGRTAQAAGAVPARLAASEADYRWFEQALTELDPTRHWGGLSKARTPDGLTVYLCHQHNDMLAYPAGAIQRAAT